MTKSIRISLACLATLALASTIDSQHVLKEEGSPLRFAVPLGNQFRLGTATEPTHIVPIAVYTSKVGKIDLGIYVRPGKLCNFRFDTQNGMASVDGIEKLAADGKIIFIWSEQHRVSGSYRKSTTTISILDLNKCETKKNIEFAWDLAEPDISIQTVHFENGFDVFLCKNRVAFQSSYDFDGNQIGETKTFPMYSSSFLIHPVSRKSHSRGFFIVDNKYQMLSLVQANGTLVKRLLQTPRDGSLSSYDESFYSVCWIVGSFVKCSQFDEYGNYRFSKQENVQFDRLIDVKSLKDGGIAIFGWKYGGNKLYVVELRPGRQINTWDYYVAGDLRNAEVMDFNEKDRTFVLAYEDYKVVHENDGIEKWITLQKLSLSSVVQK